MNLSLEGKIAIVTGSSKGIGRAAALALAEEGVDVTSCSRGTADLEDAAAAVSQGPADAEQLVPRGE